MRKYNIWVQAVIYTLAGLNHFLNPHFYLPLIPAYLGSPEIINILAGIAEVALGVGLFIPKTRKLAAWGIVMMLAAFIPSHIYFIQIGSCIGDGLCVPEWLGWVRLLLIHPLLMYWAWTARK